MRRRLLPIAAAGALALAFPSCTDSEAETTTPSPAGSEAELDDIERAANEAAAGINAENADAELEKLKAEMSEKK